jgi:hypothetical protein
VLNTNNAWQRNGEHQGGRKGVAAVSFSPNIPLRPRSLGKRARERDTPPPPLVGLQMKLHPFQEKMRNESNQLTTCCYVNESVHSFHTIVSVSCLIYLVSSLFFFFSSSFASVRGSFPLLHSPCCCCGLSECEPVCVSLCKWRAEARVSAKDTTTKQQSIIIIRQKANAAKSFSTAEQTALPTPNADEGNKIK